VLPMPLAVSSTLADLAVGDLLRTARPVR
jgi:hypothetical protein